jgi:rubredoxin
LRAEEEPMKKQVCGVCSYVYDPAKGDPDNGVPPGTPLEKIADTWRCPDCGATKDVFVPEE